MARLGFVRVRLAIERAKARSYMICISQTLAYLANQFTTNMLQTRYFFGYYCFYTTA